jgi:hypothetical protein
VAIAARRIITGKCPAGWPAEGYRHCGFTGRNGLPFLGALGEPADVQVWPTSLSVSSITLRAIGYARLRSILHASMGRNRPTEGCYEDTEDNKCILRSQEPSFAADDPMTRSWRCQFCGRRFTDRTYVMPTVIGVVAVIGLLLTVLHGIEAGIWAGAYLWLGAFDSSFDAMLFSLGSMTTVGAPGPVLHAHHLPVPLFLG